MMPDLAPAIDAMSIAADHNPGTLVLISGRRVLIIENVPTIDHAIDTSASIMLVTDSIGDTLGQSFQSAYHDDLGPVSLAIRDDAPDDVILGDAHHEAHE